MLSLTKTHLGLVAPLGPSCVHMACGNQVKPLRNLLFKLVDSHLPPALDQVSVPPRPYHSWSGAPYAFTIVFFNVHVHVVN